MTEIKLTWKEIVSSYGTIRDFSNRFEIPYRTVQDWVNGLRNPPEYVKLLICRELHLTT